MAATDRKPGDQKPGRVARRRQATRDSLMAAGQRLFAARPIDSVSVDEIVDSADVAKGSFYNHFDDKNALAQAILELVGGDCEFHIHAANRGVPDPALRVARAIAVLMRYAAEHPERVQSIVNLSERKTTPESALNRGLKFDIEDGLAKDRFHAVDLETGTLVILGMITIALRHRYESGTDTPLRDATTRIAGAVLRGLGLPAAEAATISDEAAALLEADRA